MTRAQLQRLTRALRWDDADERDLAREFLEHKVDVYVATLLDLADDYGYDLDGDDVDLSDAVMDALTAEAQEHAAYVVATFNEALSGQLNQLADEEPAAALAAIDQWAAERGEARAELTAITEAYSADADATIAFFAGNELDVTWHFGGHTDDDDPACSVCQALAAGGPYTTDQVLAIGTPHIGCRQGWHPDIEDDDPRWPDTLTLGEAPAGIVGQQALVTRNGNDHDAAVAAIADLTGGTP